jgi:hypothetical protein
LDALVKKFKDFGKHRETDDVFVESI